MLVLLLGSMFLNLILGWQLRILRLHGSAQISQAVAVAPGTSLTSLRVSDLNGEPSNIEFASQPRPSVLYVLNPHCHWCASNANNIRTLGRRASVAYRFVGISLDDGGLTEYAKLQDLSFPVYSISSYGVAPQLGLGGTPEMIVLSGEGKVLRAWLGTLTGGQLKEVEAYFAVSLPGPTREPERAAAGR